MNRAGYTLLVVAIVQLAVVVTLYWVDGEADNAKGGTTLADKGAYVIDEVRLSEVKSQPAVLKKTAGGWVLPELDGLPADSAKVEALLDVLTATDPGWAVAHSLAARQRFQVAHYHFRRKVELLALEQVISTVYLGTSPGFRKVHARNESRDEIFSVNLNVFELPATAAGWVDPDLLRVRAPLRIDTGAYRLVRDGERWSNESGAAADGRELEALLIALKNLRIEGIASEGTQHRLATREAELVIEIEALGGDISLSLYEWDGRYFIASSKYPYLFKLSSYTYDKLTGIDAYLLSGEEDTTQGRKAER